MKGCASHVTERERRARLLEHAAGSLPGVCSSTLRKESIKREIDRIFQISWSAKLWYSKSMRQINNLTKISDLKLKIHFFDRNEHCHSWQVGRISTPKYICISNIYVFQIHILFGYRLAFQCVREQLNWTTTRDTVSCFFKLFRTCDRHQIVECSVLRIDISGRESHLQLFHKCPLSSSCDPRRIMERFGIANQAKGQRNLVSLPLMGAADLITNQHRHPSLAAVIRDSLPLIPIRNTEHSTIR
eukprot:sb/3468940/